MGAIQSCSAPVFNPWSIDKLGLRGRHLAFLNHFSTGTDVLFQYPVTNIFTGVSVDAAVRDTDGWIFRFGYNITLLGKIAFIAPPIIF